MSGLQILGVLVVVHSKVQLWAIYSYLKILSGFLSYPQTQYNMQKYEKDACFVSNQCPFIMIRLNSGNSLGIRF